MEGGLFLSVFDNITKKVTGTAKVAATRANDIVEVTKLNLSISAEEDKIKKLYAELGKAVYETYNAGEEVGDAFKFYCKKIDEIEKNIEEMKQKILEMRKLKMCPSCSIELEADMAYCPKCGTKQQETKSYGDSSDKE
jgi:uncharacterized coiled-coil DUF342 family protein